MLRSILTFSFVTLLSRILGLIRDTLVAYVLGAQGLSDVFLAAFRLPNLFRAYFAEGALSVSFVPIYSQKLGDKAAARRFANDIFSSLLVALLIFCSLLSIFTPQVLRIFTPGFLENPYKLGLTAELSRIMTPYLLLISLSSMIGGVLQAHNCFIITAISPVLLNICLITSMLLPHWSMVVYHLSIAVSVAGILQFLLAFLTATKKGIGVRLTLPKVGSDVKAFFSRISASVISNCMAQISIWVNTVFASFIPGAISYIYYADRVNQLPQALVGISISTVLLPAISKLARSGDTKRMIETQNKALDLGMTLIIPAAAAFIVIPDVILLSLLNYGQFDYWAIGNTIPVLAALAASLPSFVINRILLLFFYTRGKFKVPAIFSLVSLVINAILNHVLMKFHGHTGIAAASSVASWLNAILLVLYLKTHNLYHADKALYMKMAFICLSTTTMVLVISIAKTILGSFLFQGIMPRILSLVIIVSSGVLVYFYTLFVVFGQKFDSNIIDESVSETSTS